MTLKRRSLPGHFLIFGFLLISIILFGLIGTWMLNHIRDINSAAQISNTQAAREEIAIAIEATFKKINQQAGLGKTMPAGMVPNMQKVIHSFLWTLIYR